MKSWFHKRGTHRCFHPIGVVKSEFESWAHWKRQDLEKLYEGRQNFTSRCWPPSSSAAVWKIKKEWRGYSLCHVLGAMCFSSENYVSLARFKRKSCECKIDYMINTTIAEKSNFCCISTHFRRPGFPQPAPWFSTFQLSSERLAAALEPHSPWSRESHFN